MTNIVNVEKIIKALANRTADSHSIALEEAVQRGWLEPQDLVNPLQPLERRAVARIVHSFLRLELGEADTNDWQQAQQLRDLYDCRTCVNHIAQMYCKGIMDGVEETVFGMNASVTEEELNRILDRANHPELRIRRSDAKVESDMIQITCAQAKQMHEEQGLRIIDVRSEEEYAAFHLEDAELYPLPLLQSDPTMIGGDCNKPLLVGCRSGMRSRMASELLAQAGYRELYYFGVEV